MRALSISPGVKADGIHLVARSDGDAVAQAGRQPVVAIAEVINAGSAQGGQVGPDLRRYLLIHRAGILER
jgi:hypothetical protein